MDPTWLQIGIGLAGLALGLLLGLALRRPERTLRARVAELELELQDARRIHDEHRARVEKHFERTSDLFRDLTDHYAALYSHLAEGARQLCPEGGPALGRGLDDPLLAAHFRSGSDELETLDTGEETPALEVDEPESKSS